MCGIVAAVAENNSVPVLVKDLRKLEYRGYGSAAIIGRAGIKRRRSVRRVDELESAAAGIQATTDVTHSRWATHGVHSACNAHCPLSRSMVVIRNSIIENDESLRSELIAPGYYAIVVIDHSQPGKVIGAREGSPLLHGLTDTRNYAVSDASALLQVTRNMIYRESDDIAELPASVVKMARPDGTPVARPGHVSQLSANAVELGNHQHYTQKEIFERPEALANTLEEDR